jgi:hypothetical protein
MPSRSDRPPDEGAGGSSGESVPSAKEKDASLKPARAVECAGCGRRFVGDYCPSCGQKVRSSSSVGGVAEDFARELFDIERGFLKTARVLTFRPQQSLRAYLDGDRTSLMSPGRYLLASIVVNFGVYWGLGKAGVLRTYKKVSSPTPAKSVDDLQSSFQVLFNYQEVQVLTGLLVACLLALVTGRLFGQQVLGGAKAAALGSFLAGHASLLEAGAAPAFGLGQVLLAGEPTEPSPYLYLVVCASYVWWALWLTFGPDLWAGLKAAAATVWTAAEFWVASTAAFCGWALWAVSTGPADILRVKTIGLAATGGLALAILLGHVGAEAYLRYR